MTNDEMLRWFKSAPKGSRHERRRLPSFIRDAGRRKPSSQPGLSQFRTIQVYPIDLNTALAAGCLSGSHLFLKGREFYRVA
jgi:hypothetical protein